jgi:hypothetical protein
MTLVRAPRNGLFDSSGLNNAKLYGVKFVYL